MHAIQTLLADVLLRAGLSKAGSDSVAPGVAQ